MTAELGEKLRIKLDGIKRTFSFRQRVSPKNKRLKTEKKACLQKPSFHTQFRRHFTDKVCFRLAFPFECQQMAPHRTAKHTPNSQRLHEV